MMEQKLFNSTSNTNVIAVNQATLSASNTSVIAVKAAISKNSTMNFKRRFLASLGMTANNTFGGSSAGSFAVRTATLPHTMVVIPNGAKRNEESIFLLTHAMYVIHIEKINNLSTSNTNVIAAKAAISHKTNSI